jgi:hypothetical protein
MLLDNLRQYLVSSGQVDAATAAVLERSRQKPHAESESHIAAGTGRACG